MSSWSDRFYASPVARALGLRGARQVLSPTLPAVPRPESTALVRVDSSGSRAPIARTDDHLYKIERRDTFANATKQLGTPADVTTRTVPMQEPPLDIEHAAILYRRGLYPRLCQTLALWTWGDVRWQIVGLTPAQQEAVFTRMEETGFWPAMMGGGARGWGYGAQPIHSVLSTSGSGREDDPASPFSPNRVTEVFRFQPLNPRQSRPTEVETRRESPAYMQPAMWRVRPNTIAGYTPAAYDLHGDRVVLHYGIPDDQVNAWTVFTGLWQGAPRPWADQLWGALRSMGALYRGLDRAALEAIIHVFTGLDAVQHATADLDRGDGGNSENLTDLMRTLADQMSTSRKVVLPGEGKMEAVVADFKAVDELAMAMYRRMVSEADIPQALLLSEPPPGLSTDEKSWWVQWARRIMNQRRERVVPILRQVVPWFLAEQGIRVDDWRIELGPLSEMSEETLAKVREIHTRADAMLLDRGVLSPREVRQREMGGAYVTTLTLEESDPEVNQDEALQALEEALERISRTDADAFEEGFRRQRFKIPNAVAGNARKVLGWKDEHGDEVKGMTDAGWARARQLARDEYVTGQDLIEMAAWYARFSKQGKDYSRPRPEFKDTPWKDKGHVSWEGWGGDSAQSWATETVERNRRQTRKDADFSGKALISVHLSAEGRQRWEELRQKVEVITGPLEGYDPGEAGIQEAPHVTVLYIGATPPSAVDEIADVLGKQAKRYAPRSLKAARVTTFSPSESSDGRWPVVIEVDDHALMDLNGRLLPRLAHLIQAKQHVPYKPHVTLGFAKDLDPDQIAALAEVISAKDRREGLWSDGVTLGSIAGAVLQVGGDVVQTTLFESKRDSSGAPETTTPEQE